MGLIGALSRTYKLLDGEEGHPLEVTWGAPTEEADGAWFREVASMSPVSQPGEGGSEASTRFKRCISASSRLAATSTAARNMSADSSGTMTSGCRWLRRYGRW